MEPTKRRKTTMKRDLLKGLNEEQIARVKKCHNHQELLKLAQEEGIELTPEQLEAVSGGGLCVSTPTFTCPKCGSQRVNAYSQSGALSNYWDCYCKDCDYHWHA